MRAASKCIGAVLVLSLAVPGAVVWDDVLSPGGTANRVRDVAVSGDRVVAVGGTGATIEANWLVRAHDRQSGALVWSDAVPSALGATATSAAVLGNRLFVAGDVMLSVGVNTVRVRAYDLDDGTQQWSVDNRGFSISPLVAASQRRVFTCTGNVGVLVVQAYDGLTGTVQWSDTFNTGMLFTDAAGLAGSGSGVFLVGNAASLFSPNGFVRAYDAASGSVPWTTSLPGAVVEPGIAVGGRRVFAIGSLAPDDWALWAVDGNAGGVLWSLVLPGGDARGVAASRRRVFVTGSAAGDLLVQAYDAATGSLVWSDTFDFGSDAFGSDAVLADGRLYVSGEGDDGVSRKLISRAYDPRDGTLLWSTVTDPPSALGSFVSSAAAADVLAVGATLGTPPEEWFVQVLDGD